MAIPADTKKLYIPLEAIGGEQDAKGNYSMRPLDLKNLNDNLWAIVKKIQGGIVLSDLTELTIKALTAVTILTQNLYATRGNVVELTVDRLETDDPVERYWASNTDDMNYIQIQGQYLKFLTGHTEGATTQHTDRNGNLLYYNGEVTAETYQSVGMSTTETAYPVTVYDYDTLTKMELSFALHGDTYEVDWFLGAGTGTDNYGKAHIHKDTTGVNFSYYSGSTGDEKKIRIDDDDISVRGNTGAGLNVRNIAICTSAEQDELDPQTRDMVVVTDDYSRYDSATVTASTTLSASTPEVIICNSGSALTLTLYAASSIPSGKVAVVQVKNIGAGTVTVNVASSGTIDGSSSTTIAQWDFKRFGTRNAEWMVL